MTDPGPTQDGEPLGLRTALRTWWRQPPRRHGEVVEGRAVGPLELFYDLVYVVLIAQAAHSLVSHLSPVAVLQFAIVFALVHVAWVNGTLFHDLHGREDGRNRNVIFGQMALLVLLAVFTGDAFGADGPAFAAAYVAFLCLIVLQWWSVRRIDEARYRRITGRYLAGLLVMTGGMAVSVVLPATPRTVLWAAVALLSTVGAVVSLRAAPSFDDAGMRVTDSLVERFGLFVIIVLGETVVGVVNGILDTEHRTLTTIVTALLCLVIGFGFWWSYFDTTMHREPRAELTTMSTWLYIHLPLTGAVAASGGGMVLLIEHADAAHAAAASRWLLGGAVALFLVSVAVVAGTLDDPPRAAMLRALRPVMYAGAAGALVVATIPLRPWLTALLMGLAPILVWCYGFYLSATRVAVPRP